MKVDRVGAGLGAHVVDTAQEVVWVAVNLVCSSLGQNRAKAGSDLERVMADTQESQDAGDATIDTRNQLAKVLAFMPRLC